MSWVVEYWIHYDSSDLHILEGKHWRQWREYIEEEGVNCIERVRSFVDECDGVIDREYEILWEAEE